MSAKAAAKKERKKERGTPEPRPPARRPKAPRRSRAGLLLWGTIGLVVVIVGVLVAVSQLSSTPPTATGVEYTPRPVPAKVLHEITHVPTSAYDAAGTGIAGAVNVPTVDASNPVLTENGKPEVFYLSGDFCPYCAAERWAIIASLSRFGTFTGLETMQSSPIDAYPRTPTFDFNNATYTSPYVTASLLERYGQETATGSHPVINTPTKAELHLIKAFDGGTGGSPSGSIPFSDWGNKVLFSGASYSPSVLQGLSRAAIAASLQDPGNPVTKLILGSSNYMSAAVCFIDGGRPGSVCGTSGVRAAASALGITST